MRRALGVLLVILVVAGCGGADGGGGGGGEPGELPPLSKVLFGTGYDPANFGVTGRATSLKAGTPMFASGQLFSSRNAEDVSVTISTGGSIRQTVPPVGGAGSAFAVDLSGAGLGPARAWADKAAPAPPPPGLPYAPASRAPRRNRARTVPMLWRRLTPFAERGGHGNRP